MGVGESSSILLLKIFKGNYRKFPQTIMQHMKFEHFGISTDNDTEFELYGDHITEVHEDWDKTYLVKGHGTDINFVFSYFS